MADHTFYANDAPLVRVIFVDVDGNELTPVDGLVYAFSIENQGNVINGASGAVFGNEVQYQMATQTLLGSFIMYIQSEFTNGETRTGTLTYDVIAIDGRPIV